MQKTNRKEKIYENKIEISSRNLILDDGCHSGTGDCKCSNQYTAAKVTITSVKRVSNTKTTVKWKKLKKNTSGYAVYVQSASRDKIGKWKKLKKTVKWGKYSSTKTVGVIFQNKITSLKGSFDNNENVALTWIRIIGAKKYQVYRSEGGSYNLTATLNGNAKTAYTDKYYNPTKTISYKVRPVSGIYTGSWSKVLILRPSA